MRRYAGRRDENQVGIIEALRKIGAAVVDTSALGFGFPDLIVGYQGKNYLMEVKNPLNAYGRRGLTSAQRDFHERWPGPVFVVRTAEEAVRVVVEAARPREET